jgi:hypothetical protein
LNEQARQEFWKMAEQARSRGRDLAEVLDRAGILLTVERESQIQADTLQEVATLLFDHPPHRLSQAQTVLDYHNDLARKIQALADERRK